MNKNETKAKCRELRENGWTPNKLCHGRDTEPGEFLINKVRGPKTPKVRR